MQCSAKGLMVIRISQSWVGKSFATLPAIYFVWIVSLLSGCAVTNSTVVEKEKLQWHFLLDAELSQWDIWMGVPHSSTQGLPANTFKADNLNVHGDPNTAMGLNSDIKQVFSVTEVEGELVLHITGEIYGGLTSKAEYENYHLSFQVKWGDKKWAPRLTAKRDSGLLFHCRGEHGAFWRVWKACQELQIQENDFGDYIPLAGPSGTIRGAHRAGQLYYDPESSQDHVVHGYSHASAEPDKAHGEWNTVELFALHDEAIFVVNGEVVMVITESVDARGNPLTSGQLQIQSEGAEVFYRDVKIRELSAFPTLYKAK